MPINKLRHKKGDGLMLVCKHHSGVKCEKELEMSDKFIITKTSKRTLALMVDDILGIIDTGEDEIVSMDKIIPNPKMFKGTAKLKNNLVLIYDTDRFLTGKEEADLQEILAE